MRATLRDVPKFARHDGWRESFMTWWVDWPCRRRRFWSLLLFEPGQGWLRWGTDERTEYAYIDEGLYQPEPYVVAPPLRRICWWLKTNLNAPRLLLFGDKGYNEDRGKRYRFSWEEAYCSFSDCWRWYIDKDRHHALWDVPLGWRKR